MPDPIGNTRTTTISTQRGGKGVVTPSSGAAASALRPTFTTEHIGNGATTVRLLNQMVAWIERVIAPAISSPANGGVVLQNIALSAATTTNIPHLLGKPPVGWQCIRAKQAAFSAFEATYPDGLKRDRYLRLTSNNTGTYDLWVF